MRGRIIVSMLPAFPRYIMVPLEHCWDIARDVWRVLGIVCFGDQIARVRQYEVENLVERCNGTDIFPPEVIPAPYAVGERVHIGGIGLTSGHDAIFDSVVGDGKLRLMFDMLGRTVPIDRVRQYEVENLVERCNGTDIFPPEVIPAPYAVGERVHIGGYGLTSGHDAIFDSVVGDCKLRLMFDMLGRTVPIDVDERDVFAITKEKPRRKRKRRRRNKRQRMAQRLTPDI